MDAEDELSGSRAHLGAPWSGAGAGERYAERRFASTRAAQRDVRIVEQLLREHGVRGGALDVPCGAGRLQPMLASRAAFVVGADVSVAMLAQARKVSRAQLVQAGVERLPFADGSFDVVVCCRLLHHLAARDELALAVRELVRVSSRLVIVSFWDSGSLPSLRVRLGLKRGEGRSAFPRARLARLLEDAGADVLGFRGTLRFVSQQTFAVARRRGGARA